MLGLRYELMLFKKATKINSDIMARITATLTPIMGVKAILSISLPPPPVLTVFRTNIEYNTIEINHAKVS